MPYVERVKTHGIANGGGPDAQAFPLRLPGGKGYYSVTAWISNFGGSNVHLIRDNLSLAQCQELLERGYVDIIMTVTASGPTSVLLPDDVGTLTVFFEGVNNSGQYQLVTVKVCGESQP